MKKKHLASSVALLILTITIMLGYQNCGDNSFQVPGKKVTPSGLPVSDFVYSGITDNTGNAITSIQKSVDTILKVYFIPEANYTYNWVIDCITNGVSNKQNSSGPTATVNCSGDHVSIVVTASLAGKSASNPNPYLLTVNGGTPPPSANHLEINGPTSGQTNQCVGPYIVAIKNAGGSLVNVAASTPVALSNSGFSTFSDASCSNSTASILIAAGSSSANFYLKAVSANPALQITATSSGITTGVTNVNISTPSGAAAVKADFDLSIFIQNECKVVNITTKDASGAVAAVTSDKVINLSVSSANAKLYSDSACTSLTASVTVLASHSDQKFYIKDSAIESLNVTTAASGFTSVVKAVSVNAAPAGDAKLALNVAVSQIVWGTCQQVILQIQDSSGNPKALSSALAVALSSSSSYLGFFATASCTTAAASLSVNMAAGLSQYTFYIKDTANEIAVLSATSQLPTITKSLTFVSANGGSGILDFGGMFGSGNGLVYNNPATGAQSCPSGYKAQRILWAPNVDYPINYCYRNHIDGQNSLYDFGGIFGFHDAGEIPYVNPATNKATCPDSYIKQQVLWSSGIDHAVYYCYRPFDGSKTDKYLLGGMFGTPYAEYYNVVTNSTSCAGDFLKTQFIGSPNLDYNAFACVKSLGVFSQPVLYCGYYTQTVFDAMKSGCSSTGGTFTDSACDCTCAGPSSFIDNGDGTYACIRDEIH